jgi:ceramide glucosyltransferase
VVYAGWFLLLIALCGAAYAVAAAVSAARLLTGAGDPPPNAPPPVTILKPLSGAEPELEEALASALTQDYAGPVQMVCGLADADDPAVGAVERLKRRFPDRDIALVVDPAVHGANRKVSNLINMLGLAKHDTLVLADSDIAVPPGWLGAVVDALCQPGIGAVSCLYAGEGQGRWAQLAAMGIGYQFLPNAAFGTATGLAHPCFGSTIALRRQTLDEIGGFATFRDCLADDYEIGRAVRAKGYGLAYPPLTVRHICTERSLRELWTHELRWARTIRTVDPVGHFGSAVTHAVPLGLLGAVLAFSLPGVAVLATVLAARLFLKSRIDHIAGVRAGPAWLLPVRDVLSFGVFLASLAGRRVAWRGDRLSIGERGRIGKVG